MKIEKETLDFLRNLKDNNNRDWFNANKATYSKARQNFENFLATLIMEIGKFDPPVLHLDPKKSVFRIYRDTRFSKDKTPYKTNFGAHLVADALKPHGKAGYYIHLEPGASILAGGAYLPPASWLKKIRKEIDADAQSLKAILHNRTFKKYFGGISGDQLKTAPRDFSKDHPEIDLLRHKSFLAVHKLSDDDILSPRFIKHASLVFKALKPFDDFLNRGL